jgi:hypothetical protein
LTRQLGPGVYEVPVVTSLDSSISSRRVSIAQYTRTWQTCVIANRIVLYVSLPLPDELDRPRNPKALSMIHETTFHRHGQPEEDVVGGAQVPPPGAIIS